MSNAIFRRIRDVAHDVVSQVGMQGRRKISVIAALNLRSVEHLIPKNLVESAAARGLGRRTSRPKITQTAQCPAKSSVEQTPSGLSD